MAIGTTAAIIGSAAIGAGSAALSSRAQSRAADRAADASQYATDRSAEVQQRMFDTVWNAGAGQRDIANQALQMLAGSYGIRVAPSAIAQPQTGQSGSTQPTPPQLNPNLVAQQQARTAAGALGMRGPQSEGGQGATGGFALIPGGAQGAIQTTNGEPQTGGPLPPAQTTGTGTGAGSGSGGNALDPYANFIASPDYQFRLDQGMRGGRNALSHIGQLGSGAAVRALSDYQGNMALGEFNNWRSGLGTLAGLGSQAFQTGANAAGNYANAMSNLYQNNAANQASSYQNRANAFTNGLGGVAGSIMWGLGKL